jgi:hypothetical protein
MLREVQTFAYSATTLEQHRHFSAWLKRHIILASLIVFICSIVPRLFVTALSASQDLLAPDSYTYLTPALSLLDEGAFLDVNKKPEVGRTPGYPIFVVTIGSLIGKDLYGKDLRKLLYAQTVVVSCYVLFVYWMARRILPPVMAFTGALLCAFSPWSIVLAGRVLTEGLFLFVLALIFLIIKLIQDASHMAHVAWGSFSLGLLTAAAVLIRPLWPLIILVAGILFIQYGPRRRGVWLALTVMFTSAAMPLLFWTARNVHEAHIHGISDHAGKVAWQYLASRVDALTNGQDRFSVQNARMLEDQSWELSAQEADQERWKRAKAVFRDHPFLTVYSFAMGAVEHIIHPSPDILSSARLNFYGDYWLLALLWGGFLLLAYIGWKCDQPPPWDTGLIDHKWLVTILMVCLSLTLASGMTMGAGSRMRAPLELIIPLFAGVGLVRVISLMGPKIGIEPEMEAR